MAWIEKALASAMKLFTDRKNHQRADVGSDVAIDQPPSIAERPAHVDVPHATDETMLAAPERLPAGDTEESTPEPAAARVETIALGAAEGAAPAPGTASRPAELFPEPAEAFAEPEETPEDAPLEDAPLQEVPADRRPARVESRGGRLVLRLVTNAEPAPLFEIDKSGATLGRGEGNSIRLEDLSVSRRHARISYRQGAYWLRDLGSVSGSWVDDARLNAPHRLEEGQTIDIGVCRLTVAFSEEEQTSISAARSPKVAGRGRRQG